MKIISIIPARGGSKSIPDKNVFSFANKPLIAWTIEQSLATKAINKTFVTTNDDNIAAVAGEYGATIINRPNDISGDSATSESAISHALNKIKKEHGIAPDLVVMLQATSPLRKTDDLENAIKIITESENDSLFSGAYINDFLLWEENDGKWESMNYDYKNRGRRQNRTPQFVENGSIYIFKPEILEKYENRIGKTPLIYEMEFWQTWEIDEYDDIPLVEQYFNKHLKNVKKLDFDLSQIELIAMDFDGVLTNSINFSRWH